jgi:hypothetical protein
VSTQEVVDMRQASIIHLANCNMNTGYMRDNVSILPKILEGLITYLVANIFAFRNQNLSHQLYSLFIQNIILLPPVAYEKWPPKLIFPQIRTSVTYVFLVLQMYAICRANLVLIYLSQKY